MILQSGHASMQFSNDYTRDTLLILEAPRLGLNGAVEIKQEVKVKSLYKALSILDCFTTEEPELGISEISKRLGLYKSNVHNLVDTFVKAGYLEQNPENEKYRLAYKILELGQIVTSRMSFATIVTPYMQELAEKTNEVIYLAVPSDTEVMYLDAFSPKNKQTTRRMQGIKAPMYCTGIGKAMLAYLPEQTLHAVLAGERTKFTDQTLVEREELLQDLKQIRSRGYAIDRMEHEFGIKCIGMPIMNRRGEVIAGVSISGPSLRFDDQTIPTLANQLLDVVDQLKGRI